ncbi:hypothetical protein CAEBREN_15728 [Caenorhabditis brenneri]|uniref:Ubiquitin-like domain-containing protein n=1 Tax=Caenorhabditis brenneri TaxID=135651 RepID=G0NDX0_CAEBE|nr:hypothetical protein CAEBREN_15728 [Caenorhabditis brenneri]
MENCAGQTAMLPSSWIHYVFTPVKSMVVGGNFLTEDALQKQFDITKLEEQRLKIDETYEGNMYTGFRDVMWTFVKFSLIPDLRQALASGSDVTKLAEMARVFLRELNPVKSGAWTTKKKNEPVYNRLKKLMRAAPNSSDSDDEDFQQNTLDTLRLIQQDIADAKKETLNSQQLLAQKISKRVKHLEQIGAQQTVAAKSELNKTVLETMNWQTEEFKKKQDAWDQELKEMKKELGEMKLKGHTCPHTIDFEIEAQDKGRYRMKMSSNDLVHLLKQKIRKIGRKYKFTFDDCFIVTPSHQKCLQDSKSLSESGIQHGSVVYLR